MAEHRARSDSIAGRIRGVSVSIMQANPQLGAWQAAGTAIAQAPNLQELRDPESGGDNITFNAQGHSARIAVQEADGELALTRTMSNFAGQPSPIQERPVFTGVFADGAQNPREDGPASGPYGEKTDDALDAPPPLHRRQSLAVKYQSQEKASWGVTINNGLKAFWKFFITPSGFIITIYCLNIVAWGAMLFFLLLKAAPAMNVPTADAPNSPRKIWLEISSQILNALFCVTGFGLAPWRFRDLYWFHRGAHLHHAPSMRRLALQNRGWFRPPAWSVDDAEKVPTTFTGEVAPPTAMWKLGFTIWMMVLNTFIQAVLCYFMWGYNRFDRPGWATGTFIGLGCGVAMFAGIMSWWEGRKVKKIEGPEVKIVKEDSDQEVLV
ncbi:hypothetical protein F5X68DRAFT_213304 [Plectosphaerella plurivora]|uniref:Uncharacterized protein n=1 Tax=Plectosphaerella plurivora TaxID=936078 RepID=A0A9P8V5T5_9PEZI|nr:hypothetical protein F5X68DRAFT_213304 [Plectosphaerella plurivora]